ncbi:FAD/FMN-containing dehydrogenase [Arboricoccus pini]|uniref:Delta(24)-sterol reductase n=1 Tax=Arboricoccus pini TaxID=1963835 RepID=A0A212QMW5_9PROT|nr:FAD/FMN-containing dehydrogenase [Arboricoccus pini]
MHPAHEARKAVLARAMRQNGVGARLQKTTTNLFRDRQEAPAKRLDVRSMNNVLAIDTERGLIDTEGMTPYDGLVDASLPHGLMPTVVPELRSITIGGALAGIGIESSSFRYGLVHETIESFDVLLADGEVVTCRADNEHSDLFFGFPNTFGTLGYALRTIVKGHPSKRYVKIEHRPVDDASAFGEALASACASDTFDFVEGEVFGPGRHYLSTGRFVDEAPYVSDYTFKQIYYRSIPNRLEDYLTARDFIWRWDTDWFWCSKATGAQNPLLRRLVFGPKRLNSRVYMRLLQLSSRYSLLERPYRLLGYRSESVIQDVPIPVEKLSVFLEWFHKEIGIAPVWCCPVRAYDPQHRYPLFPLEPGQLYVNVGFWDVLRRREDRPRAYYNRLIEAKVKELGGLKSLYSDAFYERAEFDRIYDRAAYDRLKARYDPNGRLKDIYDKCILGA